MEGKIAMDVEYLKAMRGAAMADLAEHASVCGQAAPCTVHAHGVAIGFTAAMIAAGIGEESEPVDATATALRDLERLVAVDPDGRPLYRGES